MVGFEFASGSIILKTKFRICFKNIFVWWYKDFVIFDSFAIINTENLLINKLGENLEELRFLLVALFAFFVLYLSFKVKKKNENKSTK